MKNALCVCMAVFCLNAYGQERKEGKEGKLGYTVLRRVTLVASCAASFWDFQTTVVGAHLGSKEGNGWMTNSKGQPRLGLMLGVKSGMCAAMAVAQEKHILGGLSDGWTNSFWSILNANLATRFTVTAIRNQSAIRALRQQQQSSTALPAYLAATAGP